MTLTLDDVFVNALLDGFQEMLVTTVSADVQRTGDLEHVHVSTDGGQEICFVYTFAIPDKSQAVQVAFTGTMSAALGLCKRFTEENHEALTEEVIDCLNELFNMSLGTAMASAAGGEYVNTAPVILLTRRLLHVTRRSELISIPLHITGIGNFNISIAMEGIDY